MIPWLCWGVWWQELLFSAPANDRLYQSRLGTSVGPGDDFLRGSILPKVHLLTSFLTLPVVQSLLVLKGFINVWTIHTECDLFHANQVSFGNSLVPQPSFGWGTLKSCTGCDPNRNLSRSKDPTQILFTSGNKKFRPSLFSPLFSVTLRCFVWPVVLMGSDSFSWSPCAGSVPCGGVSVLAQETG